MANRALAGLMEAGSDLVATSSATIAFLERERVSLCCSCLYLRRWVEVEVEVEVEGKGGFVAKRDEDLELETMETCFEEWNPRYWCLAAWKVGWGLTGQERILRTNMFCKIKFVSFITLLVLTTLK